MLTSALSFRKFVWFQAANLFVSFLVILFFPVTLFGRSLIYVLFSLKIIALIYLNDYPAKRDPYSLAFFAIACIEVLLLFLTGSFSIYTFIFARL